MEGDEAHMDSERGSENQLGLSEERRFQLVTDVQSRASDSPIPSGIEDSDRCAVR